MTMEPQEPTAMDEYLFDLRGYVTLPGAVSQAEVAAMNACLDGFPHLEPGEWYGYVNRQNHHEKFGVNLQQIYEAGPAFRVLIDHPAYIRHLYRFVGGEGTFDWHHGPLFIDENFANLRGPGQMISLHSGGHDSIKRCQFRYRNGRFSCGQVNVLLALTDIGPGDGATMVIPGSHKSNITHPHFVGHDYGETPVDAVEGATEVHMKAGDALLFVDAIAHGSAARVNPGERRIVVFRFGPSWGNFRFGYQPSAELLAALTPAQRKIVQPQTPIARTPDLVKGAPT